ncbi:formate dehydrogenase accessory protein FdhE [Xenorhabdus griffiniae]|uniref:Protein FdhE homolog n=1 Tax=Xenorhabdus griffiniae TaxID=351672 RepID=A0ABY9XHS9_9GAMM|nr:formate dehydrogenase accessory protein FdhE [Xenorhabdus griffiniae]MBD1228410.1 formate dehydrogenase accessory protein FdhE [Xenorhabdus griffiniae]MBE8587872.1 formate dehydrogenase accessory protein FdhE [Xenorhabdus griffiniae]WMV72480.1 formate dehydrogenase accessory protein FdhE [Xenorhabdus griffiniae]WNH02158.1 formate dehydrogenase accessory protein FdhE [Xenorhabdus griffiniae]
MSIRIAPIPPLLFANLKTLYQQRAERLKTLATESNPFASYLNFAAEIAQAQQKAWYDNPLEIELDELLGHSQQEIRVPLDCKTLHRTQHWQNILHALIAELLPIVPEHVKPALENLAKNSEQELEEMASALFNSEFSKVSADQAVFVWAALSVYWAQMASLIPGKARAEYGEHRQFCPICGSMPVASVVQIGTHQGLRYLHCNLCESEWHVVRIKCSNCEQSRDLSYWSLESEQSAIKAESCGDCGSYLKILYQEKDPNIDAVADDLASLILDAKMEEEGFARSSLNPFLFPNE